MAPLVRSLKSDQNDVWDHESTNYGYRDNDI